MKITTTATAWITNDYFSPGDFRDGMPTHSIGFSNHDMTSAGWVKAGAATITIEVKDRDAMVESKIESLRAMQAKTLADAQARATTIEGQIQKLLAITNEVSE